MITRDRAKYWTEDQKLKERIRLTNTLNRETYWPVTEDSVSL